MLKNKVQIRNSRNHKRLKAAYLVKYGIGKAGETPRISNVKDISAGGMRFLTRELLPESSRIKVDVMAPPIGRPLQAEAQIIRVRRTRKHFIYSVAARFTAMSVRDRDELNAFIEKVAENDNTNLCIDHSDVVQRGG